MGQDIVIPDWFKANRPSAVFAGTQSEGDKLSAGIGHGYPVVYYKGKNWAISYRGERHTVLRLDDGTPSAFLDVVILDAAECKSKSYYKTFDQNNSEGERPLCSSINGITPDPDSPEKQAETCALCPRNVFKTDPNGRRGKECTDYKRVALVVLPTQTKPIFGEPLLKPMFLRVPPASLTALATLGETMSRQGYDHYTYVTRITFNPDKGWPEMVFRPIQGLTDDEAKVVLTLKEDPDVGRIIHGTATFDASAPAAALPAGGNSGLIELKAENTVTPPPPPAASAISEPAPPSASTGFSAPPPAGTNTATVQTAEDVGETEGTDADLDARIAKLIK